MSKLTLYNSASDENELNKVISKIADVDNISWKEDTSVVKPVVYVSASGLSAIGANYAYIDTFERFYYIRDIQVVTGGRYAIYLEVDPLMTYKTSIKNLQGIIIKTEDSDYINNDLDDGSFVNQEGRAISFKVYSNSTVFLDTPVNILVAGGI